jgi:hypothetical protein
MKRTPTQILAEATSAMVQDHDVTGMLATLVRGCGEALSARAVCVLIRSDDGQIELLSSSSHAIAALELFQALQATGPCIDAISGDRIGSALVGRIVIEQAKGVIAFQQTLDMSAAYDLLVRTASRKRTSLTHTAERIVAKAQHRPRQV